MIADAASRASSAWALVLGLVLSGCAAPPPLFEPGSSLVLREELWQPFEHHVEVLEADPALGIAPGASTGPVQILWAEGESFLYGFDLDGERNALHVVYRVQGRVRVDIDDPRRWRANPRGAHEALRVDWSMDLAGASIAELGVELVEPIPFFIRGDEEWLRRIAVVRDPVTNQLVSVSIATSYLVWDGAAPAALLVLHVFQRADG